MSLAGVAALEQSLHDLRLRGAVYCLLEGYETWGLRLPAAPEARFHAVRTGACWLRAGDDPPVRITAGELILLPHGGRHDVMSDPSSRVVDVMQAFGGANPFQKRFRAGTGERRSSLICGGFAFDDRDLHPLPNCLPRVMRLDAGDPAAAVVRGLLESADAELQGPHVASDVVLGRLSEILFVAAVRAFVAAYAELADGWLGALADPVTGAALAAIHADTARDWSVAEIAAAAGVSKTTVTDRFQRLLGVAPRRYLKRWRMLRARRLLHAGALTVAEVSERVGYASEAAFSRAFLSETGVAPSSCRPAQHSAMTRARKAPPTDSHV